MTSVEFLKHKGWRWIGSSIKGTIHAQYWDHPNHQPNRRGAFTTRSATAHQRNVDNGGSCNCVPREEPR